jgi:hypothetical protein
MHGALAIALAAGALLVVAALWEWRHSRRIYAEHDAPVAAGAILHERTLAAVCGVTVAAAVAAAVLSIFG